MNSLASIDRAAFEFFAPASRDQCDRLQKRFPGFHLAEYLELLAQTNGLGEVFSDGSQRFVHNLLVVSVEDALQESGHHPVDTAVVIGRAGVDGIQFVLRPADTSVHAYYPIEAAFVKVADSLSDFLAKHSTGSIRL